ncbi:hypothetical protein BC941DRAFT_512807 [Chlamydoabsidia padenii]|nr:hypothetical protein BC941DRAFT_512807 [Chlamydoabsidia padenii]
MKQVKSHLSLHKEQVTQTIPSLDEKAEPFQIVLIDVKKAAKEKIQCIQKPFEPNTFEIPYIAISYRWGEISEQIVSTGVGYNAHITSFKLRDLYKLCKMILKEPTLKHMRYAWVDAICIDQLDDNRKKTTIYRMTDIYHKANHIVAVPDLNYGHLAENLVNTHTSQIVEKHVNYLYHMIQSNLTKMDELDKVWMDDLGIPQDSKFRQHFCRDDQCSLNDNIMKQKSDEESALDNAIQQLVTPGDFPVPESCEFSSRQLVNHFFLRLKDDEWSRQIAEREENLNQSLGYLQSIMMDWSNRTWVINEYHIAKTKGEIMYWFIHFSHPDTPLLGLPFFVYRFDKESHQTIDSHAVYHFTSGMEFQGRNFVKDLMIQLSGRSFLSMILNSKAARHEDRFHAILPLTNYRHFLKDKNTVSSWKIKSISLVRQKLLEFMTVEDKLNLLYMSTHHGDLPILPSFVTKTHELGLDYNIMDIISTSHSFIDNQYEYNFVDDAVHLDLKQHRPMIRLTPKVYYVDELCEDCPDYYELWGRDNNIWSDLGLIPDHDPLTNVCIPLILYKHKEGGIEVENRSLFSIGLQLLGSLNKNCWILYEHERDPDMRNLKYPQKKWVEYQLDENYPTGLRVF